MKPEKGEQEGEKNDEEEEQKQTPWLKSAGANYTDRATAACRRS
jgi:hypothetical protein